MARHHPWNPRLLRDYGRQRQFLKRIASAPSDGLDPHDLAAAAHNLLLSTLEVMGGEEVRADADPFRDCCLVWDRDQLADYGSGVYLGGRIVVSAAHVVDLARRYRISLPLTGERDRTQSMIDVTAIRFRKSDSPPQGGLADLALLLLAAAPPPGIDPPRLALPDDFDRERANPAGVDICGFGQSWDPPGIMERRGVKRVARSVAVHPSPPAPPPDPDFDSGFEFIAGGRSNGTVADTCFGDSGGPAYLGSSNGSRTLLGITSRGIGNICGNGTIYTRIDAHRNWILSTASALGAPLTEQH